MPVRRTRIVTRRRKKIQPRSKEWYEKKYSVGQLATKAMNGVQYLRALVNSEKKFYDINASSNVDYNGQLFHLTPVPAGTGVSDRTGVKIAARSLYIRTNVYSNNAIDSTFMRIIIFYDKFNTGSAPVISDIINTVGSTHATTSPLRLARGTRYEILYDKVMTSSKNSSIANARNIYLKLYRKINYTNTLGTDEYANQLYMLAVSNISGASSPPSLVYSSRFGYMDN